VVHFSVFLIYFANLFHLIDFFGINQISTASDLNNRKNESKNDIHVFEIRVMLESRQQKEILNIVFRKHDHKLMGELFLNSIKRKQNQKIMKFVKMS
jgi:hypothetical protein